MPTLFRAKEVGGLLRHPAFSVRGFRARGETQGSAVGFGLTAIAGLMPRLSESWPEEEALGDSPWWKLRTAARRDGAELVAVEGPRDLATVLPHRNTLILPRLLAHALDVTGSWDDIVGRFHPSIRRNEQCAHG